MSATTGGATLRIEEHELSLAHVGLGTLSEAGALTLFAVALSHAIGDGAEVPPNRIRDAKGRLLYPAYFRTLLRVPDGCRLESFGLWDRVRVSVEVSSFGGMMLESVGQLAAAAAPSNPASSLTLHAGSLFVVDESRRAAPQPGVPAQGQVAQRLAKLSRKPDCAVQFDRVRDLGVAAFGLTPDFEAAGQRYPLVTGRDVDPGHAMFFSTFARLLLELEAQAFGGLTEGPLRERDMYYFADAYEGDTLVADLRAAAVPAPDGCAELVTTHTVRSTAADRLLLIAQGRRRVELGADELRRRLTASR